MSLRRRFALVAVAGACIGVSPTFAQTIVYDPTAAARLAAQAQTALQQLEQLKAQVAQGQKLYAGFSTPSNVNAIASALASPALRSFLPDAQRFTAAGQGDFSGLGALGAAAAALRAQTRIYTPSASDPAGAQLEASGARGARDLALGQQVATVSASRLQGLQQLQGAIGTAADARAVLDLQARLQAEQAMISNDQVRLQGLAMAQAAEDRMQVQRDRETAAKAHAEAQAAFRSMTQ